MMSPFAVSATGASSDKKNGSVGSSHSVDGGKETDEDEEDDNGKSRMQKWNDLPTWAHALIIGGSILVGLVSSPSSNFHRLRSNSQFLSRFQLLVVMIARCFW